MLISALNGTDSSSKIFVDLMAVKDLQLLKARKDQRK